MSLALIAGRGGLPVAVRDAQSAPPLICALEGAEVASLRVDISFRLETLGTFLLLLKERGVMRVCFCGGVDRPKFDPSQLDAETVPLVPLFQKALAGGDDAALRILKEIFERQEFEVVGADRLLPALMTSEGVFSALQPDAQMLQDAMRGFAVLEGLAALDIGQACVVGQQQVLSVEAFGGTDHMLETLPASAKDMRAVLCKRMKAGQIREIDLPTIGPETIEAAHCAGLAGVVIEAGNVIVLDPDRCAVLAGDYDMVLWSRVGGTT
ncbi:MAG: UDP-2,3-diacylglucosamine diphosphatase LpxI [Pseudomonadota bacterium]